jgi:hypothetical protein
VEMQTKGKDRKKKQQSRGEDYQGGADANQP